MRFAYLVHDLADPAVARRVAMFREGGADVAVLGFRRSAEPIGTVAGVAPHDLGLTRDGRLVDRALSVLGRRARLRDWGSRVAGADVIVARNLEMLVLAAAARRRFAPEARLHYELLDIHRLLVAPHIAGKALRRLERSLLAECDGVIVSSPAFGERYLRTVHPSVPPVLLAENKVAAARSGSVAHPAPRPCGPPWRIGWFGVIRCRRSLLCLADLLRRHPGLFEVDIRGRIAGPMGEDFQSIVDATPGLHYHGRYDYPGDLAEIYGRVHFSWAVDYYEEGFNSTLLLPNRLYESAHCGAVPIALAEVETGRWLARHGLGVTLGGAPEESLGDLLSTLTPERYRRLEERVRSADRRLFAWADEEYEDLVCALAGTVSAERRTPVPAVAARHGDELVLAGD